MTWFLIVSLIILCIYLFFKADYWKQRSIIAESLLGDSVSFYCNESRRIEHKLPNDP